MKKQGIFKRFKETNKELEEALVKQRCVEESREKLIT